MCDEYMLLLKFLMSHKFSPSDYISDELGLCRLHAQLARNIATLTIDQSVVQKIVATAVADLLVATK